MKLTALFLPLLLLLSACATPGPAEPPGPDPDRQSQLTALFDRFGGEEVSAKRAAAEAAQLKERERRFLASLWATRSSEPLIAWRYADALAAAKAHDEAFAWYQRAFKVIPAGDSRRAYLRYELAEECLAMGRAKDAINLLANSLDPAPLPDDLKAKYEALLDAAARAGN